MPITGSRATDGSIEVHIEAGLGAAKPQALIYVLQNSGDTHALLQNTEDGWLWVDLDPTAVSKEPDPTMRLDYDVCEVLMQALAQEVMGVEDPVERQSRAEGRLEATERHLDDLRHLLGMDDELHTSQRTLSVE